MLVTVLVIWVVVVPALTVATTYVFSGVLGRHLHARPEPLAEPSAGPAAKAPAPARPPPIRVTTRSPSAEAPRRTEARGD